MALAQVMEIVDSSSRTIARWVASYQQVGLSGLKPGWRGENAKKMSDAQRAEIVQKLQTYRPDQVLGSQERGNTGAFWTVRDVRLVVRKWAGVEYQSDDAYRALLYEAGFSYQRTEGIYRSQPSQVEISQFEVELEKK